MRRLLELIPCWQDKHFSIGHVLDRMVFDLSYIYQHNTQLMIDSFLEDLLDCIDGIVISNSGTSDLR